MAYVNNKKGVYTMPRPRKCRKVCCLPNNSGFIPINGNNHSDIIILNVDEYESIRLIDKEGFSQEQCGEYMNIARTTVQQIYTSARKKLAIALVEGLPIRIEGGDYQLCEQREDFCSCGGCRKHIHKCNSKGGKTMKIALPLDENKKDVCVSFARAPYFLFSENGKDEVIENPAADEEGGAGLKAAQFIIDNGADTLITVRCGQNAADVFKAADIKIYKAEGTSAHDNVLACNESKLEELTHFHAGFHGIR